MQDWPKSKNRKRPEKKKIKGKFNLRKILIISFFSVVLLCLTLGFIGAGFIYFYFSKDLPDVRQLKVYQPSTITQIYSDSDDKIAEFYIEKRIIVELENIPLSLKQATLAVEDSNFYYHFGIDPKAIFRAFITNIKAGHVVEGGSTITSPSAQAGRVAMSESSRHAMKKKSRSSCTLT